VIVSFAGKTLPEAVRISLNVSVRLLVTGVVPLCCSSLTSTSAFDLVASTLVFELSIFDGDGLRDSRSKAVWAVGADTLVGMAGTLGFEASTFDGEGI
jgi:hypothetical protein